MSVPFSDIFRCLRGLCCYFLFAWLFLVIPGSCVVSGVIFSERALCYYFPALVLLLLLFSMWILSALGRDFLCTNTFSFFCWCLGTFCLLVFYLCVCLFYYPQCLYGLCCDVLLRVLFSCVLSSACATSQLQVWVKGSVAPVGQQSGGAQFPRLGHTAAGRCAPQEYIVALLSASRRTQRRG